MPRFRRARNDEPSACSCLVILLRMHSAVGATRRGGPGVPPHASRALVRLLHRYRGGDRHKGGDAVSPLSRGGGGGEGRAPPGGLVPAPAEGPGNGTTTKHTAVLQLDATTATSFFGVYDGHGGPAVSRYCGKHLHVELRKHPQLSCHPISALEETFLRISSSTIALSVPVTAKTTESGENGRLAYSVSAMKGFRENMEDAHTAVLQLDAATATSFFGVYDGHGGPAVSRYCGKHLHVELRKHRQFRSHPVTALEETFLRMDEKMRRRKAGKELSGFGGSGYWDGNREAVRGQCFHLPICAEKLPYVGPLNDGCTACVVLIRGNDIIVGNAGDSRCVLSRNNLPVALSTDFKPDLPGERRRIENAGRAVTITEARGNIPRIDAGIAVSRTLGDLTYKNNENLPARQQAITALPEVHTEHIDHDAQFLILTCDGIWDCMTNQQAVDC